MPRIIKFRVWDNIRKIWHIFTIEDLLKGQIGIYELNAINADWDDTVEYTGLKDKEGVEIWEGDILLRDYSRNIKSYKELLVIIKKEIKEHGENNRGSGIFSSSAKRRLESLEKKILEYEKLSKQSLIVSFGQGEITADGGYFENGYIGFKLSEIDVQGAGNMIMGATCSDALDPEVTYEVIGNIYQNKDLK